MNVSPIEFREADPSDAESMSVFRALFQHPAELPHRSISAQYYKWKVFENPHGNGLAWIAESRGECVGMVTVSPRPLLLHNRGVFAGELGDGFVHPDYQGRGIFRKLLERAVAGADREGYRLTYGTPTPAAFSVEKRVGYSLVRSLNLRLFVRPVNSTTVAGVLGRAKKLAGLPTRVFQRVWDSVFGACDRLVERELDEMSNLVSRCRERERTKTVLESSPVTLTWRYETNPDHYSAYSLDGFSDGDGYAIVRQSERNELSVLHIADLGFSKSKRSGKALLRAVVNKARSQGDDLVATWGGGVIADRRCLFFAGFVPVRKIPVIVRVADPNLKNIETFRWRFCMGDSDNI